jgi:uncharacterized protein YbaP (TraB family)
VELPERSTLSDPWACRALAASAALVLGLLSGAGTAHAAAECLATSPSPTAAQWAAAQPEAIDRGLLWRLSKDGHVSYLFGTIHVGTPSWRLPGPVLRQALAHSEVLAVEIDPADPAVGEHMARTARASVAALPEPLQQRLQEQIRIACLPQAALRGLHPVLQVLSLSVLAARREALDPAYAQETMLAAMARRAGLPIVSLEGVDRQLQALLPENAGETQAMVDQALVQLERGSVGPVLRHLAEAWAAGDLDTLHGYASWCECADTDEQRVWLRRLNDERNPGLADGIAALHRQGQRVFAAVGALHMTGPAALQDLLVQRGFAVERMVF